MQQNTNIPVPGILNQFNNHLAVKRLTALWAFSEAALGGVLHAAKVPFTGLFIGGVAIILISLIFHFSEKKTDLLKSTLLVILVKGLVSPYTPLAAYLAVFIQGMLGYALFNTIKSNQLASVLLGFFAMFFASMQKIIIYTIIYGNTLWESIDLFGTAVLRTFGAAETSDNSFRLSYMLIGVYVFIHLTGGLTAGFIGARVPFWIKDSLSANLQLKDLIVEPGDSSINKTKRRRVWWKKKSFYLMISLAITFFLMSILIPGIEDDIISSILYMFVRASLIILVWYNILYPFVSKFVKKYLAKKSSKYKENLDEILILFPHFKGLIKYSWHMSRNMGKIKGIKQFISITLVLILTRTMD